MKIYETIISRRTTRKFRQEKIDPEILKRLVNAGRLAPSAANLQPLKYFIADDKELKNRIFPNLAWAGYLKHWQGPEKGERPSSYVIILGDTDISKSFGCDHGIAAQSIMLGAAEKGLGGCMIGSIKRNALRKTLEIPDRYEILLVLALGKPKEKVVVETIEADGDIKYWRDDQDVHHVPKRSMDEIIVF